MKRKNPLLLALFLVSLFPNNAAFSRDINLDDIYVKGNNPYTRKLFELKLDAYLAVQSQCVDRNVIFAEWLNGFEILYIREINNLNILSIYHRKTQRTNEFLRLDGTITVEKVSPGGRYLLLKRILITENGLPAGDALCIDLITKKQIKVLGSYPFLDFSLAPGGTSVLFEEGDGIHELSLVTRQSSLLIGKKEYADIASLSPSIAMLSPNRKKVLIINGSGGSYQAKVLYTGGSFKLSGITSSAELCWISNSEFAFRKGGPGYFSAAIYDTNSRTAKDILDTTFHASIMYSPYAKFISCLKDQVICFYSTRQKTFIVTGLEGDDISFSTDGNRFTSLLYQRLFITNLNTLLKKQHNLQKVHKDISGIYKKLLDMKEVWENEYSADYLKRKMLIYSQLSEFKNL